MNLQEQILRIQSMMDILNESYVDSNGNLFDLDENIFDEFPPKILETLENNYFFLYENFDWNEKVDQFTKNGVYDGIAFNKWLEKHRESEFKKNIKKIISSVRKDIITIKRSKLTKEKLRMFEELIIPVFGSDITSEGLSEFEEKALLFTGFMDDIETQKKKIKQAFEDAKKIIDDSGNVDYSKINKSKLFPGGHIDKNKFEEFVKQNPKYKKTYQIWLELFNEEMDLSLKNLISFNIVSYQDLKDLYNYLLQLKKEKNL